MKQLTLLCLFSVSIATASADEWLDITDSHVANPSFLYNTKDGWSLSANASSTNTDYACQEFWNGTFNMYQTISGLSNGKYRVSVSGFYRNGDASADELNRFRSGTDSRTAYLYANNNNVLFQSIYSEASTSWKYYDCISVRDRNVTYYIPNSMYSASCYFADSKYNNSLEVNVTDGQLTFGVRNQSYVYSNWCIFTNFRLEYYCKPETLSRITFPQERISIGKGETFQLVPQFTPALSTATKYELEWSSSDESVVAVGTDGLLRAVDNGEAVVTCLDLVSGVLARATVSVVSTDPTAANVIINEIQVSNVDQFIDPSFNYGGWVELYNPTSSSVFLGNAYIKDHKGHSFRLPANFGSIPSNGYRNIWFDHNSRYGQAPRQVPFKLDKDGGTIIVCNSQGEELVRQDYPEAVIRTSYSRTVDGGNTWAVAAEATPEASNATASWGTEQLPEPVVSLDGCMFYSTLSFSVSVPAGCKLVYTVDGSTPTLSNGTVFANSQSATPYNCNFRVTESTVYRFRLFQDGKLPSEVVTRSYIHNDGSYKAPVVSVVANYDDLMGNDYGVYVRGNGNGRPGNGQSSPCNWNMEWERAVNFEYMVPDANGEYSSVVFNQLVDFEMCGGWSRAWEPHSFKLKANKMYGAGNLDYTFFGSKPYNRNKSLQLRNGGNDTGCRFKDAALQEIVRRSGLYVDGQAWQPVHVFINGEYKKVLNMREPNNKHNAFANYGIDGDYVDQFEMSPDSGYVQKAGTKDAFNLWYQKSITCGNIAADYKYICDSLVDIEEFANYMAVEMYLGATDWPQNNVKAFRAYQDDENGHPAGKFHFVLFDLDGTFATNEPLNAFGWKQYYTFDVLYGIDADGIDVTGQRYNEEIEFVTIFLNMLQNADFRKRFVDAYCLVAGSVFDPVYSKSVIEAVRTVENEALAAEWGSCNSTANTLINQLSSSRQISLINHLQSYLGLSNSRSVSLSSNVDGARILVNGQEVPTGQFSGTLFGDIKVQAVAPAGYRFAGWWGSNSPSSYVDVFSKGVTWSYYCDGSLDNKNWTTSMSSYKSGKAPLGYGKEVVTTLTGNKPTYYFGKTVSLTTSQIQNDLLLSYTVDDGFVIYVNGKEAGRYNMPSGSVSYETLATTYANDNPDTGTITLNKSLFKVGLNTISVEVHNNSTGSSDIMWDASLAYLKADNSNIVSTDSVLNIGNSNAILQAHFEPIGDNASLLQSLNYPIRVNEVSPANDIYVNEYWKKNDWIELYNCSDVEIDVAGLYVSDNIQKPTKYQIVGNFADDTKIPAGGRLLLWADKVEPTSQIHTGFKLGNDLDAVVLVCSSAEFESNNASYFEAHPEMRGYADALVYDVCQYTQSVGRYPDGCNAIYRMQRPSIDRANIHSLDDQLLGYERGVNLGENSGSSGIEELVVDSVPGSFQQWQQQGGQFYDLQGRPVACPQHGQLLLRGKAVK